MLALPPLLMDDPVTRARAAVRTSQGGTSTEVIYLLHALLRDADERHRAMDARATALFDRLEQHMTNNAQMEAQLNTAIQGIQAGMTGLVDVSQQVLSLVQQLQGMVASLSDQLAAAGVDLTDETATLEAINAQLTTVRDSLAAVVPAPPPVEPEPEPAPEP